MAVSYPSRPFILPVDPIRRMQQTLHAVNALVFGTSSYFIKANSWMWQGVSAKAYITLCEIKIMAFQTYKFTCTSLIASGIPSNMSVNPPGGLNFTVAIFALVGATFSIVGFIVAHYSPRHQYGDLCRILNDINDILSDYEWLSLLPSDQSSKLYLRYCSMSADLESLCYLVSMPSYVLIFYVGTALRLRSLRIRASQLKIELIALCQIERGKKIQKIMEMSFSPISATSKTVTTSKVVNGNDCLPV